MQNELAQQLTWIIVDYFTIFVNKTISPIRNQLFYRMYAKVYTYFTM